MLSGELLQAISAESFELVADELVLDDETLVWYVESGRVDVFLAEVKNNEAVSSYKHMARADEGRLLFSVDQSRESEFQLRMKGFPGFKIHKIPLVSVLEHLAPEAFAQQVDLWLESLSQAVAEDIPLLPSVDVALLPGVKIELPEKSVVSSQRGLVWVQSNESTAFLSTGETDRQLPSFLALCPQSWATYHKASNIETCSSADLLDRGFLVELAYRFQALAVDAEKLNRKLDLVDIAQIQIDSARRRQAAEDSAREELARVASQRPRAANDQHSALLQALRVIGKREGIEFIAPESDSPATLTSILLASGVRGREVDLTADPKWWLGDSFSMLANDREDLRPIALLPSNFGRYRMIDPAERQTKRVGTKEANSLGARAWVFYRPLPKRPANTKDILKIAGRGLPVEASRFLLAGLAAGFLAFAPAFALATLAHWLNWHQNLDMLPTLAVALVIVALLGTAMTYLQSSTLLRVEARATTRLSAALWDRILGIAPNGLQGLSAGELASRAMIFQNLRDRASGLVASALTSVLFIFPLLFLLFLFDTRLALISLCIGFVALACIIASGVLQIRPHKEFFRERQRLSGALYQLINGIHKLRSTGAEQSAFAFWAKGFVRQKETELLIARINTFTLAITSSIPFLAAAALFTAALLVREQFSISEFLLVYAGSMLFFSATARLGASVQALASIIPEYQQVLPLLRPMPEGADSSARQQDIEISLRGELRFDHVNFHYPNETDFALKDISLHILPGQFVAIVGESGAGKTSLINLALGLEQPASGSIYFDKHDLSHLNKRSLRRQIGVVVQNGSLQPGTLLHNITGVAQDLSEAKAWEAARLAGVEEDIRQMHLGMHTPVGESSSLFSGGQIQRILIAAAIIRKPRVVFLDEATNWLDNRYQSLVMRNIEALAATRVVVAHRLSTIKAADKILVLEKGRLVQSGNYPELASTPGLFQSLIERQLLEEEPTESLS